MRVWDIPPEELCRQHLLGEHREIHAIWTILTRDRDGYRNHPEVKRWEGRLVALKVRHGAVAIEMARRGFNHSSMLGEAPFDQSGHQKETLDSPSQQRRILTKEKQCEGCTERIMARHGETA